MNITIEKIDLLKERAQISYSEARDLLEQFDGNVVEALIHLEQNNQTTKPKEQPAQTRYTRRTHHHDGMDKAKDKITKVACLCVKAAYKCESQMQEIIKWMAEAARLETEMSNQDQEICKLASKRAEYYISMCKSSDPFTDTCLGHPFMNEAIKKLFGKSLDAAARKNQNVIRKQ